MPDKRNRGCFGQTLFAHGQPTYIARSCTAPPAQIYAAMCAVCSVRILFSPLSLSLSLPLILAFSIAFMNLSFILSLVNRSFSYRGPRAPFLILDFLAVSSHFCLVFMILFRVICSRLTAVNSFKLCYGMYLYHVRVT